MPQIQGVRGQSCIQLPRAHGNEDAEGVRPEAMGYHRLSRRVNKIEIKLQNSYFTADRDIISRIKRILIEINIL
jgi:hypothetical protein